MAKLFSEDLGGFTTTEEFLKLQKQFPTYDHGYIVQSAHSSRCEVKEWIEQLWTQCEKYLDTNFQIQLKLHFAERAWELYMCATLLNHGFELSDHKDAGPDFCIKGQPLTWIEAIAPERGKGDDKVPEIQYGVVCSVPEEQMILRITNALREKYLGYEKRLKDGIIKPDEPYIIAINRSDAGNFPDGACPLILRATFGIGYPTISFPIPNGEDEPPSEPQPGWSREYKVKKNNGEEISTLFFEDKDHACISAAIYCTDDILNSPRTAGTMGSNFLLVHNPLALNPLPDHFLPFCEEWRVRGELLTRISDDSS